jgi:riboflavin synthase
MFSGIVSQTVKVHALDDKPGKRDITLEMPEQIVRLKIGDSVAVNGTCLTVVTLTDNLVSFEAVPQTLQATNLGLLQVGDNVNAELAMCYGDPVGGHMVQGHVDTTLLINNIIVTGAAYEVSFNLPERYRAYVVDKGYVTLDGMSITVQNVQQDTFSVALIPHTRAATIAGDYKVGSAVNFEVDMMAKYIKNLMETYRA